MSANKFTDEFQRNAVAQVEDRGYPVREVAERLGVSTKSIYTWQRLFSRPAEVIHEVDFQANEIRRLKRDLARVTEERDILKKAALGSTGQRNIFDLRCSEGTHDGTKRSLWLVARAEG